MTSERSPAVPFRVLVVDDEHICRQTTVQQLRAAGYFAGDAASGEAALERIDEGRWDVVITDLRMPGLDGLELLEAIRRKAADIDAIVVTAFGTVETAVDAMRRGAVDYLLKPFAFRELDLRLKRLQEERRSRQELGRLTALLDEGTGVSGIVGRSPPMRRVCERIRLFADHDAPVLVTGETGTGKEVVARAIHELGPRRHGPFIAIPCGAIPRELAESYILGHERGSFTGALQRRKGCFEEADGGTLLLDDIDDLPLEIQVKLLRVLQEGQVVRVGSHQECAVNVRVIATSKLDLAARAASGAFRSDLYYRLCGLEAHLPPVRERGDDVILLAQHFLRSLAGDGPPKQLSGEAADVLRAHDWPGNVREIRRVMESAVVLCAGPVIRPDCLGQQVSAAKRIKPAFTLHLEHGAKVSFQDLVARFEDEILAWAMSEASGQQIRAAEILGLPRTTLQSRLKGTRTG